MDKLLLRACEVAELLNISRASAYEWMAAGVLPVVKVGRSVRVPYSELLTWINRNTRRGEKHPWKDLNGQLR